MNVDPDNPVVQLCAKGMEMEGLGKAADAMKLFTEAWDIAKDDFEKLTAAHYIARHQPAVEDKLEWDKKALAHALGMPDESKNNLLPSLYLNIAKCHEDLNDIDNAKQYYELANSFTQFLPEDGYGKMIDAGIQKGLERVGRKPNM